jgi:hypothetical protein
MGALLAREVYGELEFAGPAILRPSSHARAEWATEFAALTHPETGIEGAAAGQQGAMAQAGDQGQGSAS